MFQQYNVVKARMLAKLHAGRQAQFANNLDIRIFRFPQFD